MRLKSYAQGEWIEGKGNFKTLYHAVTGEKVAEISSEGLDFKGIMEYARSVGNPILRNLTFHDRGRILKELAKYLMSRKDEFYPLSYYTGATKIDSWIDIEGGISTFFTYAGKGRRELPDDTVWVEGSMEPLSKEGTFVGQHICVPLTGVAVHINAYNFPVWGMLEKLAPTFLAGMPAIVKPSPVSVFLAERVVRAILDSEILPEGALQLICGEPGDLLDHLRSQDVVTFTGSEEVGKKLKAHPAVVANNVRFNLEVDSLNCSILGPDVTPDMEEFRLFTKEVVSEMTVKAGQKCTAIRRTFVPESLVESVTGALIERLSRVKAGDPAQEGVKMGTLADRTYKVKVKSKLDLLKTATEVLYETKDDLGDTGTFFNPVLLYCGDPYKSTIPHDVEAFGPVNTIMPYKSLEEVVTLANMGQGSLVASLFTADDNTAKEVVRKIAPYHGRILVINSKSGRESTGHGSPLPHLVHGGPGRAGGGEEMGGIRGILKYMQRTAVQGHPTTLTRICNQYVPGAEGIIGEKHPFKKYFDELVTGETYLTHRRTVTETDVVNFAGISGDFFYAHMDELAAGESMFEKRVAHGYFVLSAAAGLFVDPAPGPVIANYGLEGLRFVKPVYIGDTIRVRLVCKRKIKKEIKKDEKPQGIVEWYVEVLNQGNEIVAVYTILTLVERKIS